MIMYASYSQWLLRQAGRMISQLDYDHRGLMLTGCSTEEEKDKTLTSAALNNHSISNSDIR